MMNFEQKGGPEKKAELTPEQFRTDIENALNEAMEQINKIENSEMFPTKKEDLMKRMKEIVLPGLNVERNLDSMFNI